MRSRWRVAVEQRTRAPTARLHGTQPACKHFMVNPTCSSMHARMQRWGRRGASKGGGAVLLRRRGGGCGGRGCTCLPGSSIGLYAARRGWSANAPALNGCMKALQMGALQEATVGGSGGRRRRGPPPVRPSPAPPGCLHRAGRPQRTDRAAARPGSQDIAHARHPCCAEP